MGAEKTGVKLIAAERERQVSEEGWTHDLDDKHDYEELVAAARSYLASPGAEWTARDGARVTPMEWPWERVQFKPTPGNPVGSLVKAGALIAAEIDRLLRASSEEPRTPMSKQGKTFEEALSWIDGAEQDGYPSEHAALVEYCFAPPESYDDTWLNKIWEVYEYIEAQPCLCTEPAVDQYDACPRCRLLNREFDKYVGHGR